MDEAYLGEIRPISFTFAPRGWAFCNGQLLPINQNQALFALLGTQFGGDGRTTFGLPDLRSRLPIGTGQLQGGSNYVQGQMAGTEGVKLTSAQMPQHNHQVAATLNVSNSADEQKPNSQLPATGTLNQYSNGPANVAMGGSLGGNTTPVGGSQPHENRQPYLAINYVIALQGLFPSRP
jgi:microcystin-dependent protein